MIGPNLSERLVSFGFATSLHVAFGVALFFAAQTGAPASRESDRRGDKPLIVELIPLDRAGETVSEDEGKTVAAAKASALRQAEASPPAPGAAGAPEASQSGSVAGMDDDGAAAAVAAASLPDSQMLAWRADLQSHLARHRLYPPTAARSGEQGVVLLHFVALDDGTVEQAWVETSSGVSDIDREAIAAILRAQPLPPFPGGWPRKLDVRLPVSFRIG